VEVQAAVLAAALLLVAQALLDKVSLAVAVKQAETAVVAVEPLPLVLLVEMELHQAITGSSVTYAGGGGGGGGAVSGAGGSLAGQAVAVLVGHLQQI
jgi:uncharacterized membrane protein YgcG